MRISLAESDRERLGCPEWLDVDLVTLTNWDMIRLQSLRKAGEPWAGYADVKQLGDALTAEGQDFAAITVLVWLALAKAGVKVAIQDLTFRVAGTRSASSDAELAEAAAGSGKAPDATPASTP